MFSTVKSKRVVCLVGLVVLAIIAFQLLPPPNDVGQFSAKTANYGTYLGDPSELIVDADKQVYVLNEDLVYVDRTGQRWEAEKGLLTDGASLPRFVLSITGGEMNPEYARAAIVHDAYCQCIKSSKCPEHYHKKPWQNVHEMFYYASQASGAKRAKADLLFAGVWICGPRWGDDSSSFCEAGEVIQQLVYVACKQWMSDKERSPKEIRQWLDDRQPDILKIVDLQSQTIQLLKSRATADAGEKLRETEQTLAAAIRRFPDDSLLQNLLGYHHKNLAIQFQQLGLPERAESELVKAEKVFQQVLVVHPRDPSAMNGIGSVLMTRGDLDGAEVQIRKALKIDPTYLAAKDDLKLLLDFRNNLDKTDRLDASPKERPPQ